MEQKHMKKLIAAALLTTAILPIHAGSSQAFYTKEKFPVCTDESVTKRILKRFNKTEKIYWQERGLVLNAITNPHLHSENPFPKSPINRRYCHGDAVFQNGKKHRIHFLIEEGAGFASYTWNVEYCIHGLDPWSYYDGYCRVLSR